MIHENGIGLMDRTVRSSIDDELIPVDQDVGVETGGETIEWFVARALEELSGWHGCPVAVCDDDHVRAEFLLDAAQEDVV